MLLLDYNDDLSLHVMPTGESNGKLSKEKMNFDRAIDRIQSESAKIHINALSPYVGFGGGSYQITDVKRMTATEDFLNMPLKDRNCEVELYENCRTRKLLEECNCVPWEVPGFKVKHQRRDHYSFNFFQGVDVCNVKGRDCIERSSAKTYNCSTTCMGIYADVQWREMMLETDLVREKEDSLDIKGKDEELYKQLADLRLEMKQLWSLGQGRKEEVDKEKYKMMVAEYRKFKARNMRHFKLNVGTNLTAFGE